MRYVMTAREFTSMAKKIAGRYKTLYIKGCFGAPMTPGNKARYCNNDPYNRKPDRTKKIQEASSDTFGFDCVCLIKGILWGWNGDLTKANGGALYGANGVPDIDETTMIQSCRGVSTEDWPGMASGEVVWMSGHIGIYIGGGLAVECSPRWQDKVQVTAVANIGKRAGYESRMWVKHGKLPWIDYEVTLLQKLLGMLERALSTLMRALSTLMRALRRGRPRR